MLTREVKMKSMWSTDLRDLGWILEELKDLSIGIFVTGGFLCWGYFVIRILAEIFNFWEVLK